MANSPTHRFGQIIGDLLELAMINYLMPVANQFNFFLDYRHQRVVRNNKMEVIWKDVNGNKHKLDIVMEEGGSQQVLGIPRVFIEIAWRRYTKHSKNKAQEISGAILPLVEKYRCYSPFYGAIIAGDFTQNSINQLLSEGFCIVYFPLVTIEQAFMQLGINAHWDENTPDEAVLDKIKEYEILNDDEKQILSNNLIQNNLNQLERFKTNLINSLNRKILSIRIISVYGNSLEFSTVKEACNFIINYNEYNIDLKFYKYEIYVKYTNGDKIEMQFCDKHNAISFLNQLL